MDRNLVTRKNPDVVHSHFSGYVAENDVTVLELHTESRIGQVFNHLALHLDRVFLAHPYFTGRPAPLKFAFFKRLSYWWVMMYACTWDMKSMVTTTMISSDVPPK